MEHSYPKRFYIFGGADYESSGGARDFLALCNSVEDGKKKAHILADTNWLDWLHIADDELKIVACARINGRQITWEPPPGRCSREYEGYNF